ncbi:hypothetical protein Tco_1140470, partial [Tanacetum coccineum]
MAAATAADDRGGVGVPNGGVPAVDRSSPETRRKRGDDDIDCGSM